MSLTGFKTTAVPDVSCIKFVYSDYRQIAATATQAEYVFRLNSLFDPDFTGVGGQPDYFDQWKLMYTKYRVVATEVEVQAVGFSGIGFIAIAPTVASTALVNAEEAAGLPHAKGGIFTLGQGASTKLRALWHMSSLAGVSDEAILANPEAAALVGASPTQTFYLHVCAETNGATDSVDIWTKLTFYTRMESADYKLDSLARHGHRFGMTRALSASPEALRLAPQTAAAAAAVVCDTDTNRWSSIPRSDPSSMYSYWDAGWKFAYARWCAANPDATAQAKTDQLLLCQEEYRAYLPKVVPPQALDQVVLPRVSRPADRSWAEARDSDGNYLYEIGSIGKPKAALAVPK